MVRDVGAVANAPDHQAGAAYDITGGENARQAGHHRLLVDAQRAPAGDAEFGRAEELRQVLGTESQSLDEPVDGQNEANPRHDPPASATGGVAGARARAGPPDH